MEKNEEVKDIAPEEFTEEEEDVFDEQFDEEEEESTEEDAEELFRQNPLRAIFIRQGEIMRLINEK